LVIRSHLKNTRTARYRPIFSSARRVTGHSSTAYGARDPTPQSEKWAITRWAAKDFPPGRRKHSLKYRKYIGVVFPHRIEKFLAAGRTGTSEMASSPYCHERNQGAGLLNAKLRKFRAGASGWLILTCILCSPASAAGLEIPLVLDYRIMDQALRDQVFSGPGATAEVFADRIRCNTLVLSDPRIAGADARRLRMKATVRAQTGTPLGGKCWFSKSWDGLLETFQTADAHPDRSQVSFKVVDSTLLSPDDQHEVLPRFLRKWVRDYVYPRLAAVRIDLEPVVTGVQELLDTVTASAPVADGAEFPQQPLPLKLADIRFDNDSLVAILSADVPAAPPDWTPPVQAPLSEEELARWDASWQAWDGFATWLIKTLADSSEPELRDELAETLLTARYDLRDALSSDEREQDPVRSLFLKTWELLAPLLHQSRLEFPGSTALQYAAFISAGDALRALDSVAPHVGMRLDRNSLRSLARVLVPGVTDFELRYDTAVDPELRAVLGFDAEFEEAAEPVSVLSWLISSAYAAQIDPELIEHLNEWIPQRKEIDHYLQSVEKMLLSIAQAERDKGKVPAAYFEIYERLLRATAWQESCWRQFIEREGSVETIRSSAGSVGMMQINMHVWRGVYDIDELTGNIGYNTRAGNEILVHYLVDYALRKNEHEIEGQPDSLARATYAVYNGGPRHLRRYRDPDEPESLKIIDQLFWDKYRAIQSEGIMAVKQCLAG